VQFLSSLFGGSDNIWLTAAFALGAVIVLIVLVSWVLRLFTGAGARTTKGRNRRLAVVDSLVVDPKRTLLIVRRDDVEHLILTGGPADVVVESGIAPRPAEAPAPRTTTAARTRFTTNPAIAQTAAEEIAAAPGNPAAARPGRRHPGLLRPVSRSAPGTVERLDAKDGHDVRDSDMNDPHDGANETRDNGQQRA